jgi:ABC-type Zn uptake system ZnuABC Zn-binding protein ZnuA|tara:strand:+ start:2075 stop:2488 length:414 start_codon:yes stop_codon:yes gene_type:complete
MKGIFDWLKQINTIKSDPDTFSDKDWEVWNSYMVHRFLSMNKDYLELVNETQKIMPQNKKEIYSIYREYIPKNNSWNKYIKSKVKKVNPELLTYLSEYWECSKTEVKEYITLLDTTEIRHILETSGFEKKEITKILK